MNNMNNICPVCDDKLNKIMLHDGGTRICKNCKSYYHFCGMKYKVYTCDNIISPLSCEDCDHFDNSILLPKCLSETLPDNICPKCGTDISRRIGIVEDGGSNICICGCIFHKCNERIRVGSPGPMICPHCRIVKYPVEYC